jgi:Oxidoreductase-like protein, N-terminal
MPSEPAATDPMPEPPPWPDDDACCGGGCDPCIYDLHAEALTRYRAALAAWQARHPAPPADETVKAERPT